MKPIIILVLALALAVSGIASAQEQSPVTIKTHPVAGKVYMLEGRGGNIGVSAGEDGILIVDTQFENMASPITDALKALNKGSLELIVNTHFHGDHTGGNKALAQEVPIVAHENVRKRMAGDRDLSDAAFRNSLPTVTYAQGASIHFNGEEIKLLALQPGHTDTDSLVHFTGSNVYHTGDQFTNGMYPFIDLAGGGDVEGYLKNVALMVDAIPDNAKIIPGHGPLATKKDLLTFQQVLNETIDIVRKGIAAGKGQEELQKEGLPEKYKSWSPQGTFVGEQRWISIVFQSLSR